MCGLEGLDEDTKLPKKASTKSKPDLKSNILEATSCNIAS